MGGLYLCTDRVVYIDEPVMGVSIKVLCILMKLLCGYLYVSAVYQVWEGSCTLMDGCAQCSLCECAHTADPHKQLPILHPLPQHHHRDIPQVLHCIKPCIISTTYLGVSHLLSHTLNYPLTLQMQCCFSILHLL